MGAKTKIDWADATWNPVTGCLHGCEYCYARRIAERFGLHQMPIFTNYPVLREPVRCTASYGYMREMRINAGANQPYPFDFTPTFHRYKLDEPQHWKKPRTIFVCSMADLFGNWVPDEWIAEIFKACEAAPQHRYLFLTKNPKRYVDLYTKGILRTNRSFWYGSTVTKSDEPIFYSRMPDDNPNTFCSIEPILEPLGAMPEMPDWVIVGAETGRRDGKVVPQKKWIDEIVEACRKNRKPIFMKESLRGLMGEDFRQESPWEEKKEERKHDHQQETP